MKIAGAICAIVLAIVSVPREAFALSSASSPRVVGILFYTLPVEQRPTTPTGRAFVEGLSQKGWFDSRNVRIVWRSANGHYDRIPALIEELVRMPVDVLVVSGNDMAREATRRSASLPIVCASADYPVEDGLVASLSRPGGTITGISNWVGRHLNAKRLELLKEAAPNVARVAVLGPLEGVATAKFSPESEAAARSLGLTMFKIGASRVGDLESAFESARREKADAIFVLDYPLAFAAPAQLKISELALRHRLPVIHSASTAADAGALLTYGPDITDNYRRAGHLVDKILRGAKPADIPFEEPSRLQLTVNLKAARAIGVAFPPSVMVRASRVIE